MKKELHPENHAIQAQCVCGNSFPTSSTQSEIKVEICSKCHPFFSGVHKFVDSAGRIERFTARYQKSTPRGK